MRRTHPGRGNGRSIHRGIVSRKLGFALPVVVLAGEPAIAGGFLQLGTGRLDEKEDGLVKPGRLVQRVTSHNDSRAAMPFAPVIKGELNFRANPERPLRQKTDPFGRPVDLIFDEID